MLGLPPAFNLSHDQTLQFKFFSDSTNTDFKTNIHCSFEKIDEHVILKLLPFQQNGNELTVPKLSKLNFVLVTQFIETKLISEEILLC